MGKLSIPRPGFDNTPSKAPAAAVVLVWNYHDMFPIPAAQRYAPAVINNKKSKQLMNGGFLCGGVSLGAFAKNIPFHRFQVTIQKKLPLIGTNNNRDFYLIAFPVVIVPPAVYLHFTAERGNFRVIKSFSYITAKIITQFYYFGFYCVYLLRIQDLADNPVSLPA